MLDRKLVEELISVALSTGGDFAEVFVEDKLSTNIRLIGGSVENSISGRDFGIGIRIFKNLRSIYAYTNQHTRDALVKVTLEAAQALKASGISKDIDLRREEPVNLHRIMKRPNNVVFTEKLDLLRRAYEAAKGYSNEISQVYVTYFDEDQKVLVANSEGTFVEDERIRTRFSIESIASKDNEMQTGRVAPGKASGFEFYDEIDVAEYAKEASRMAVTMLHADLCPSGKIPVVIDNRFGGVIFHEACGHGLEASSVARKSSVFADKIGEQVASEVVTAIDDGTIPNAWGSANIDDEGTRTQKNILIENGILKGYMIDRLNARRMEMDITGSSRRQSYKFAPTSRMTNTFIAAGKSTPEEIIANTEFGLFAKEMGGGSVNPATGDFNFAVMEGYLIKNGQITTPVRGATLIGNGPNILKKIDMVGNNLGYGQGMCGASSGSIPTDVGQPTLRVQEITVGGRREE